MAILKSRLRRTALLTAGVATSLSLSFGALAAENRQLLPGQDIVVVKLLTSADHYNVVIGLGWLESSVRNVTYLAYEQQGTLQSVGLGSGATAPYAVRRLSLKSEAFDEPQQPYEMWIQGIKFDLFIADTQLAGGYSWQGVGVGMGLMMSPLGREVPLHVTVGADIEPLFLQMSGSTKDQYQLNSYQELEYFLTDGFGVTIRHTGLSTGNGLSLDNKASGWLFGLRMMF